ncbi:MAG: putative CRISPR-associated protein [Proteobacteria bacterium]|nr:putative CRISPR-associated protein [Pseudomonadota bacterium]
MHRKIICTVGTSLLTNRDKRPWAGWSSRNSAPLPDKADAENWLRNADVVQASAETNTLHALELSEGDELALLHSDTPEGHFCAAVLAGVYRMRCRSVSLEQIGRLGYGAENFTKGLKSLVDITLRLVHKARERGQQIVLCATGGFKAEIAFLNLLGALLEIETAYMHEQHRKLVRLPRLPLTWNADFVLRHEKFFTWIDEEPRKSNDVESWLQGNPELRSLVEDDDDGHTFLTAAGDLLFKAAREQKSAAPRATWPEAELRLPEDKNKVSSVEHHRPPGWERFVERLCKIDCVSLVRYDVNAHGGTRVKIMDGARGVIGLRFGEGESALPLRVETTARSEAESELVASYLRTLH